VSTFFNSRVYIIACKSAVTCRPGFYYKHHSGSPELPDSRVGSRRIGAIDAPKHELLFNCELVDQRDKPCCTLRYDDNNRNLPRRYFVFGRTISDLSRENYMQ